MKHNLKTELTVFEARLRVAINPCKLPVYWIIVKFTALATGSAVAIIMCLRLGF